MRRARWLWPALLALGWACKGLLVNEGNDFPCDFSQPAGLRDRACAPGETCGVSNHCQRFVYEGPQFEGPPSFPDFGTGGRVHPTLLDQPVTAVSVDPFLRSHVSLVTQDDGGTQRLWSIDMQASSFVDGGDEIADAGTVQQLATVSDGGLFFLSYSSNGATQYRAFAVGLGCVAASDAGACLGGVRGLRVGDGVGGVLRAGAPFATVGQVSGDGTFTPMRVPFAAELDGGADAGLDPYGAQAYELQWVARNTVLTTNDTDSSPVPVAVTAEGFFVRERHDLTDERDSGWAGLLADGETAPSAPGALGLTFFRRDPGANVWAVASNFFDGGQPSGNRISTWLAGRQPGGPIVFSRAWSDCVPCPKFSQGTPTPVPGTIVGVAPRHNGVPTVEVLCDYRGSLSLVEVLGSTAADVGQTCETQPLELPFDAARVARIDLGLGVQPLVEDVSTGFTVALGGKGGEVWSGLDFSTALPAFLERVPTATGLMRRLDGGQAPVAITDRYLAALQSNNGFKAFKIVDSDSNQLEPRASVNFAPGWFVDAQGRVLQMTPATDAPPQLSYGPTLLDAHGQPAHEPFFGEAVVTNGALTSFVMAADDSLYLVPSPTASADPSTSAGVLPELSPEPNVPVRSFTLERTPIGTDGVTRVRGYLVTSRNVYQYQLSGTPPRWSATELPLSAGEPVEVWMDNPRGGLGRVGYRDGTVLTLPGGFVLATAETPLKVLDYENYGGWPVAYTTSGLYLARWPVDPGLTLLNKTDAGVPSLPMKWEPVALPDGGTPWLAPAADGGVVARPARLQVVSDVAFTLPDAGPLPEGADAGANTFSRQTFHLLLYLDDAVYEVGEMTRVNKHQVTSN